MEKEVVQVVPERGRVAGLGAARAPAEAAVEAGLQEAAAPLAAPRWRQESG